MTDNILVLLAVAKSASSGRVGASQRRFCALAVYGLRRRQNCQLPLPAARAYRREYTVAADYSQVAADPVS